MPAIACPFLPPIGGPFERQWRVTRPFVVLNLLMVSLGFAVPPVNDHCADATAVGDGSHTGTNLDAATDGTASCGFLNVSGSKDVWWRYTAPVSGTATINTCGSVASPQFDSVLSVFDECAGTELACNDDAFLAVCFFQSEVHLSIVQGETYLIRVAEYRARTGNILLNITSTEEFCGDGACNAEEDACTCPEDSCPPVCGDRCCNENEDAVTCPSDCATLADFADFQICFSNEQGPTPFACGRFDFDYSTHIGLFDFEQFLDRMFVGP